MTPWLRRPRSLRIRLALLFGPTLGVWLASLVLGAATHWRGRGDSDAGRAARQIQRRFDVLLREADAVARTALDSSPWRAAELAGRGPLAERLEGVGILDQGSYLQWVGAPVEPEAYHSHSASPVWTVRLDGVRTRLVARAGPNAFGLFALAAFVLDSTVGQPTVEELLDSSVPSSVQLELHLLDSSALYGDALTDPEARRRLTHREVEARASEGSPILFRSGELLAVAQVEPVPARQRGRLVRAAGAYAAAVVFVVSLGLVVPWARACGTALGLLGAWLALLGARVLLVVGHVPAHLLPRDLGSPSLYGSSALGGMLGSPADLVLSAAAFHLACTGARIFFGTVDGRRRFARRLAALALAILATAGLVAATISLGENGRVPLLPVDTLLRPAAPALLLVAWGLMLAGTAELWAVSWIHWPGRARVSAGGPLGVAAALAPVALVATLVAETASERTALQRLRSEFAPQVLGQSSHRRVALLAAVRRAAAALGGEPQAHRGPRSPSEFLAFKLWVDGDLFHGGYKSSLDLYSSQGVLASHFGFDLPLLAEEVSVAEPLPDEPVVREEDYAVGALTQRVLHAELAVRRAGALVGVVVGHVLEEPSNLPFLPTSEPYLAALGPGGPYPEPPSAAPLPDYVLYDRRGTVLLQTLDEPPTLTRELEVAATHERAVRLWAGEDAYAALPLLDGDRLHLLLLRSRTALERLGSFVRLALFALALVIARSLLAEGLRPHSLGRAWLAVRGSFYRKLVAALLAASVLPLIGLALFVRGYVESRSEAALVRAAVHNVSVAQRVVEDFLASQDDAGAAGRSIDDWILYWLRRLVEQEIHVYRDGRLEASSKRELFASGLLPSRLPGEVQDQVVRGGLPYLVLETRLGPARIPVAYAPLRAASVPEGLVVAVPLTLQRREIERTVERVVEVLVLATVLLAGLLTFAAAMFARTVARPVRELVEATARIAQGDYREQLVTRAGDEVAALVRSFNSMASALAAQRRDLERRRDYMEALLRNATTGVVSTDAGGRVVTVNPAMSALLGLAASALRPGANLIDVLMDHEHLRPVGEKLARPGPSLAGPSEVDLQSRGQVRRFRLVRVDLPDPAGEPPGSLVLIDDVTDMTRSNQLAAWAEMARAIAHEIKNPLTPIRLSTEHLERVLRDRGVLPSPEIDSCLGTVIKQVRSLQEIAAEFSAYARLPALSVRSDDPVALMREVVASYRAGHPPGITIEERYVPSPSVSVDRRVLGRALVNLIENALQAMPEGGRLTVSVAPDQGDGSVVLSVQDTGTGLSPEVRARLFEPYFSTKSSGTGLGLAIVQRAVQAHRGQIEVDSGRGRGTTIRIRLPAEGAKR
jgi:PAS domain S-box-containing protein